jgi:hypothetical protein
MKVHNYTYLDEAEIVDVNGSKFAVGEDDTGYLTILSGEIVPENEGDINEEYFFTYDRTEQGYTQIPTDKLLDAVADLEDTEN